MENANNKNDSIINSLQFQEEDISGKWTFYKGWKLNYCIYDWITVTHKSIHVMNNVYVLTLGEGVYVLGVK